MDKQTSFPSTQEKLEPCLQSEGEDENWVNVDCDAAPVEIAHDPLHNSIGTLVKASRVVILDFFLRSC